MGTVTGNFLPNSQQCYCKHHPGLLHLVPGRDWRAAVPRRGRRRGMFARKEDDDRDDPTPSAPGVAVWMLECGKHDDSKCHFFKRATATQLQHTMRDCQSWLRANDGACPFCGGRTQPMRTREKSFLWKDWTMIRCVNDCKLFVPLEDKTDDFEAHVQNATPFLLNNGFVREGPILIKAAADKRKATPPPRATGGFNKATAPFRGGKKKPRNDGDDTFDTDGFAVKDVTAALAASRREHAPPTTPKRNVAGNTDGFSKDDIRRAINASLEDEEVIHVDDDDDIVMIDNPKKNKKNKEIIQVYDDDIVIIDKPQTNSKKKK